MNLAFGKQPERVLVTGGTGFIGQRLVAALLADGHDVVMLSREPRKAALLNAGRARCYGSLAEIPRSWDADVIVNLAGARILGWRWTRRRRQTLLDSRVGFTQKLVAWISQRRVRPRLLLSASAIGYYGVQPQGDAAALAETAAPKPVFMSQLCQEWERAAAAATQLGVKVVCTRLGLVLGHGGALPMMLLPVRLGVGGRLGSGRQWVSWIHIEDVLRAIAHVWSVESSTQDSGTFDAYNFCAPEQLAQLAFNQTAALVLHRPCVLPMPGGPVRLLLGEQADLLLEGQRVHPSRLLQEGFQFSHPTLEQALRDLCRES